MVNYTPTRLTVELLNNNYKPTINPSERNSPEQGSSDFGKERAQTAKSTKDRPVVTLPTVKPMEVMRLAPVLTGYLSRDLEKCDMSGAIDTVIRAAEAFATNSLGVSPSLWTQAVDHLGIWGATLAVMVVAAKDPEYFSRTPAHYFAGMVAKAKEGTLRLDRSIWGLRTRFDEERGGAYSNAAARP